MLVYARNMFGSSSVVFRNLQCLQKSLEKVCKSSENFQKGPSGLQIPVNFGKSLEIATNVVLK